MDPSDPRHQASPPRLPGSWSRLRATRLGAALEAHAAWAAGRTGARRPSFAGVDLSGMSLRGADLRRADLARARLTCCDLSEARLQGADLSGADLTGAHLRGADLRGAKLAAARLRGAWLIGARLDGCIADPVALKAATVGLADLVEACRGLGRATGGPPTELTPR